MTPPAPTLALSGSGVGGGPGFSVALRTAARTAIALPEPGTRADLAVLVQRACAEVGIAVRDVAAVAADRGPGSYTGLRVAVTYARSLAAFGGAELYGTDSLSLAAAATLRTAMYDTIAGHPRIVTVLEGRQQQVHCAMFALGADGVLTTMIAPMAVAANDLGSRLERGDLVIAAPALRPLQRTLAADAPHAWIDAVPVTAAALLDPRLRLQRTTVERLEPLYLMGSYAS